MSVRRCPGAGAVWALALCLWWQAVAAQVAVPALTRPVMDLTNTLTAAQIQRLEGKIKAFEAQVGGQLAVLLVPTTQPEDIAEFGIRVADAWKIGRKPHDDGLIVLVAKDDRRMRIEVGYGLEGAIPDAIAKRIVDEVMRPHFQQGRFYAGIDAAVAELLRLAAGEALPRPDPPAADGGNWQQIPYLGLLAVAVVVGQGLAALLGRPLAALLAAAGSVAAGALALSLPLLVALVVGAMVFLMVLLRVSGPGRWRGGRGGGSWGGGRGGRFGGGGASGSW